MNRSESPSLAIVIPCLNEEPAVAGVVQEYRTAFPAARILVVDNGSADRTGAVAAAAGAEVLVEPTRGKARAVLAAWAYLDEDLILMVDGDGSYPAEGGVALLKLYDQTPADLVSGVRTPIVDGVGGLATPFRPLHHCSH